MSERMHGVSNAVETAPAAQMWIDAAKEQSADPDTAVLVVVSGRYGNTEFRDAVQGAIRELSRQNMKGRLHDEAYSAIRGALMTMKDD